MADNFSISVVSIGKAELRMALGLAFAGCGRNTNVVAYSVIRNKGLLFYWTKSTAATDLPFKLDLDGAVDFVERWLAEQEYPQVMDFDGTAKKGWQVYNEGCSRVGGDHAAFVAIRPEWLLYGK